MLKNKKGVILIISLLSCHNPFTPPKNLLPKGPRLKFPKDGDSSRPDKEVLFGWHKVPDVESYFFQISEEKGFKKCKIDTQVGTIPTFRCSFSTEGNYFWRVRAKIKEKKIYTPWSSVWKFTISWKANHPPEIPANEVPKNKSEDVSIYVELEWESGDKDLDSVEYFVYLQKDSYFTTPIATILRESKIYPPEKISYELSSLDSFTTYYWQIKCRDKLGATSTGPVWQFRTGGKNLPPISPQKVKIIPQRDEYFIDEEYYFITTTTDPEGDEISYMFDCGDGNIVGWTEFLEGGEECKVKYMYTKVGNFYIKAKARDRTGGVSGWGDSTLVKIKAGKGVIWVVDHGGGEIIKLSKKGHFIRKTTIPEPFMVKVDPTDGSVWVVSTFISELRKLSYDGDLLIFKGYPDFPGKEDAKLPTTPCIDGEGNLWVTLSWVKLIVKLNKETGEVMKVIPDTVKMNYRHPVAIDIDKERNHIWVAEPHAVESTMGYISKIDANSGEIIWRKEGFQPAMVKVDQPNHICWITDPGNKRVVKMYPTGDYHVQTDGFSQPWSISIDEKNGQIWVGDKEGKKVVVLEETRMGKILEVKFNQEVGGVEVDPFTGECWVAVGEKVVKLSSTGEVTVEVDYPFIEAVHISINPNVDPE